MKSELSDAQTVGHVASAHVSFIKTTEQQHDLLKPTFLFNLKEILIFLMGLFFFFFVCVVKMISDSKKFSNWFLFHQKLFKRSKLREQKHRFVPDGTQELLLRCLC